ncbi:predicted protein [Uncinocarpus reesii 1704]|uniref:Uncharacterized protein n=1 Tax=Uncinocarpus reesii (strain UAMH 1704) TaxID=336963 RepID=C4JEX2_UNCRE|nr:uncharacterized protein UREG_00872 [Uncinocarpus reesii 1704]EEP76025.1 predicted protein [Uncinocarpus reesii 1704]
MTVPSTDQEVQSEAYDELKAKEEGDPVYREQLRREGRSLAYPNFIWGPPSHLLIQAETPPPPPIKYDQLYKIEITVFERYVISTPVIGGFYHKSFLFEDNGIPKITPGPAPDARDRWGSEVRIQYLGPEPDPPTFAKDGDKVRVQIMEPGATDQDEPAPRGYLHRLLNYSVGTTQYAGPDYITFTLELLPS